MRYYRIYEDKEQKAIIEARNKKDAINQYLDSKGEMQKNTDNISAFISV